MDPDGRTAGRLEEVCATCHGDEYVVTEYLIGVPAVLERLSLSGLFGPAGRGYRARWDQLDVRDPETPRLRCRVEEFERFGRSA